ncbi:MAG: DUF4350 domain-containing protein, partial [Chitinophagaceae bacterium]
AYVAFNNLQHLFPAASVYSSRQEPGYWDSLSNYDTGQVYIVITDKFGADKEELKKIISFVEGGNDVFISARYFSAAADAIFGCSSNSYDLSFFPENSKIDSMRISLRKPMFGSDINYSYPGKTFYSYFDEVDTTTTDELGYDEKGRINFIHLRAGKGNFYLHMEPLAFSNYFLLHKNNITYYEKALSVINPAVTKIIWDEYYLLVKAGNSPPKEKKSWLSVLFRYPALKAALLTAILSLLIYVVLEMRRKQRFIPVIKKPKNDSLDFVKTIGRLYFDKGDHKNLSRKMAAYFMEQVRNKYKLSTGILDEEFINNLKFKSGADETSIREIVSFIKYIDEVPAITSNQLITFHKKLDQFYKAT